MRDMSKPFGDFVRDQRRQCGLTQREVAEALGLKSIAFLSDIEAGNRKPAHDLLPALARVLKTDIELLKSHDIRSPLAEVRTLLETHPEYAVAFRRVVEHSKELGADEVLRRIERPCDNGEVGMPSMSRDQKTEAPRSPIGRNPARKRHLLNETLPNITDFQPSTILSVRSKKSRRTLRKYDTVLPSRSGPISIDRLVEEMFGFNETYESLESGFWAKSISASDRPAAIRIARRLGDLASSSPARDQSVELHLRTSAVTESLTATFADSLRRDRAPLLPVSATDKLIACRERDL
jgi:transcriptional regulator with XRE-family HTH domain